MKRSLRLLLPGLALSTVGFAQTPIAYVPLNGAKVSGALEVANGKVSIGSNGMVTAEDRAVTVDLPGRGEIQLCATSSLHLAMDKSVGVDKAGLLMALDRGAMEARLTAGKYSDVLMTPDFRILVSGPGSADLRIRVNAKGDTCLDNHGENAPYVTVSSLFDGGAYRVQGNQRVLFEHGSLHEVVDREKESCGCPPPSTGGENSFPVAVSTGLAPPPVPNAPVASPGETHTKVTAQLSYDGVTGKTNSVEAPEPAQNNPSNASPTVPSGSEEKKESSGNFFQKVGRFFGRIFGQGK